MSSPREPDSTAAAGAGSTSSTPTGSLDEQPVRDYFDDVPEDGQRAGTHRAADAPTPHVTKQILGLLIAGALALGVGAVAYVVSGNNPTQAQSAGASTSASSSPAATTASPEATVEPDATVQVGVYNAAQVDGAAGSAAQELTGAGWTVASIDNWGAYVDESVVYYADDEEEQAQAIADELGIDQIVAEDAVSYPIVVVIGTDIAGGASAASAVTEDTEEQGTADGTEEGAGQDVTEEIPAEEVPVVEAPVEEVPAVEVPVEEAPAVEVPVEQAPVGEYVDPAVGGGTL